MAWVAYHSFLEGLADLGDSIDWDDNSTTTVKVALLKSTYTPAASTHDFWNDLSGSEVTGSGYTAGGNAAGTKTVTLSAGTVTVDANDPATWTQDASGFNDARYAALYKDTGSAATSPLVAYADLGGNKGNVDGDLTIQFSGSGIFTIS